VGGGGGIHVFAVDPRDCSLKALSSVAPELNAGYICISPDGRYLYATDERKDFGGKPGAGGGVVSFAIDQQDGSLTRLSSQRSMGAFPAYIAIDRTGSRVVTSNHGSYDTVAQLARTREGVLHLENTYDDATIAMFSPSSAGLLGDACDVAVLERGHAAGWEDESGLDAIFRASPHAHSVNFDPSAQFVLACDKGTDRIYVYRIEAKGCALKQVKVVATPMGTAPRHSAFHPRLPYVFVINELQPSLSSFSFDAKTGDLQAIQTIPTVAKDAINRGGKRSMPADVHVHPNGRFVYGSTRGNDTIAIFRIDEATGRMTALDEVSTRGATPRGFNFDPSGRFVLVGNQDSNTVVTFAVDPESGQMSPTGAMVEVPRPVCIRFAVL
jgi:6-phosphogluconolactonase